MEQNTVNENLVSPCGFYCGECKSFKKNKCTGCATNKSSYASKCKVRACCSENGYSTCAECVEFKDVSDCKKQNSSFIKFFSVLVGYDRPAAINEIRECGKTVFAEGRIKENLMWVKRK